MRLANCQLFPKHNSRAATQFNNTNTNIRIRNTAKIVKNGEEETMPRLRTRLRDAGWSCGSWRRLVLWVVTRVGPVGRDAGWSCGSWRRLVLWVVTQVGPVGRDAGWSYGSWRRVVLPMGARFSNKLAASILSVEMNVELMRHSIQG
jgi:hypothetical protein